jgi:hypothetical protein
MSKRKQNFIKIYIGSEYIPDEPIDYSKVKHQKQQSKNNMPSQVQHIKSKRTHIYTSKIYTPTLQFKSNRGEPYVYIIDLVTNQISDPIPAIPYIHCYNEKCKDKHHGVITLGSKLICKNCEQELDIKPHLFFDLDKITYERKIKPENTKDLDENGIPLSWELVKIENILGTTFNDSSRGYDKMPQMKPCEPSIYSKYYQLAKVNPNDLKNKKHYKLLIYREYAIALKEHIAAGLISVTENGLNKWKLIKEEDPEQFITAIAKIPRVDGYVEFEQLDKFKDLMQNEYLKIFGEY